MQLPPLGSILRRAIKPLGSLLVLAIIVAAGLVLGPRSTRELAASFEQVRPGMTKAQVLEVLGEPDQVTVPRPEVELLRYDSSRRLSRRGPRVTTTFAVVLERGRVVDKLVSSNDPTIAGDPGD